MALAAIVALLWRAAERPVPQQPGTSETLLDVAVFPCDAMEPSDSLLGINIGQRVARNLVGIPGISTANAPAAFSLYERRAGKLVSSDWTEVLRASHAMHCDVDRTEGGLDIDLRILDETGSPVDLTTLAIRRESESELQRWAAVKISMHIIGELAPDVTLTAAEVDLLARYPAAATRSFFLGEDALRHGAWRKAERRYREALDADSTFTLARLRLAEARRWLADRPIGEDLVEIQGMELSSLSPLDSLLLEAGATPHGPAQLAAYEEILARPEYRFDPYATLLYADELYHRGGLWGVPLDSAVVLLELAVSRDSFLVPAVEHLTQALIRTGRCEEARAVLRRLTDIHASPEESDLYYPYVWGQGLLERCEPEAAGERRADLAEEGPETLSLYARWVRYIDNPPTQVALGRVLREVSDRQRNRQSAAQGFISSGLGLIGQGMIEDGIAAFDSAARRMEMPETAMQAAEWHVMPFALGLEGFSAGAAEHGERALEVLWNRPDTDVALKARAATALAVLADRRGEADLRDTWSAQLDSLGPGTREMTDRPSRFLAALSSAADGDYRTALDSTADDLAYDSAGLAMRPFLRSALYLKRGEWYRELNMLDSAIASWLWHENTDLEGMVPPHLVQAGEVDGALGTHARLRIVAALSDMPESSLEAICPVAREVVRLWQQPDSALAPLRRQMEELRRETCPP